MAQELLINVSPLETRIALVSNGRLREMFVERKSFPPLVGNVYLGKVTKILSGANAAFVNCGLERSTFLSAKDARFPGDDSGKESYISDSVEEGSEILVQVVQEPMVDKGARVRSQISLVGRYLVFMPYQRKVNVSRRLTDAREQARLTSLIEGVIESSDGVIVRTIAEGVDSEVLVKDLLDLKERWSDIQDTANQKRAPATIYTEIDPLLQRLRDRLSISVDAVLIDDRTTFSRAQTFCESYVPTFSANLKLLSKPGSAFDNYELEQQIEEMSEPEVLLSSGGTLYIEETQSMTVIDVNSARSRGASNRTEVFYQTNLEAAREVAWQLQLRNIGGIVVIDFINMRLTEQRDKVLRELKTALAKDPARVHLTQFSRLGLVELTRMRTRRSHVHELTGECEHCEGVGRLKTAYSVAVEVLRHLSMETQFEPGRDFSVITNPEVVAILEGQERAAVKDLERQSAASFTFVPDPSFARETFELMPV